MHRKMGNWYDTVLGRSELDDTHVEVSLDKRVNKNKKCSNTKTTFLKIFIKIMTL